MTTNLSDYNYRLPRELIASRPLPDRDAARMMVLRRDSGTIEHCRFRDFAQFLNSTDLVVLNNTRVLPARCFSDDGRIEFFVLERVGSRRWRCLVKPGKKMRTGDTAAIGGLISRVEQVLENGERIIAVNGDIDLYATGSMPLPPYIERASDSDDEARYQTVYAEVAGAVAAPTAGLHFTPALLSKLQHTFITLHVGPGTFRPVQTENIAEHRMHAEPFSIPAAAAASINAAKGIVAVGTTTVRVLESAGRDGHVTAQEGSTDIFIYPPFQFRMVDALLTNFHLPRSTLLMLVSAFAGREFILQAYEEATNARYRFFSYGDCMLIL